MRPIPRDLMLRYPSPPETIPERPWWKYGYMAQGHHYFGRYATGVGPLRVGFDPPGVDAAADYDKRYPIPHPGFRPGQVWAILVSRVERTDECSVVHPAGVGYSVVTIQGYEFDFPPGMGPWRLSEYAPCSDESLLSILKDAFLLADPCCPHLAPWAPAEVTK